MNGESYSEKSCKIKCTRFPFARRSLCPEAEIKGHYSRAGNFTTSKGQELL